MRGEAQRACLDSRLMGEAACCSSAASEVGSYAGLAFWEAAAWMTKPSARPTSRMSFEFGISWPAGRKQME